MGREVVQTYGSVTTRVVGTSQTPVTSSGSDVTVTGVAGALVTDMTAVTAMPEQIVWSGPRNGYSEVFLKNADGSGSITNFTVNGNWDYYPQWSPDGSKLVWQGTRGTWYDVLVKNADGSGTEFNLSNNPEDDHYPQWSPDGTKIAWQGIRNAAECILVKNTDGTGPEVIVTNNINGSQHPQWSPDGTKLVYEGMRNGNQDILIKNADGSGPEVNISNSTYSDNTPQWSPDGTRIVWVGIRNGHSEVLVKNASGVGREINISNAAGSDLHPQWSPDSQRIVWSGNRNGTFDIFTRNADAMGAAANISNDANNDIHPQWSPDGTKIVWQGIRGGDEDILVKSSNGTGNEVNISNNTEPDYNPQWSPAQPRQQSRLVGTNGVLGTTAAGFLIGQRGSAFGSVVTFDTAPATRANARVSAQTAPETNGPNVVFLVSAGDALTSLRFTKRNGSSQGVTTVIGPGAVANTATHALVSFDAATGQVSLVMPYNANRSVSDGPDKAGNVLTYRGRFPAAFDGTGKNLAPNGATEVQVNARTGQVVSVR